MPPPSRVRQGPKIKLKGVPIDWDEEYQVVIHDYALCGTTRESPGCPCSCHTPALPRKRP